MIVLECNYSKKLSLPNYSSHQFSVSLKTELTDINQIQQESNRLYQVLQQSVDENIQQVGFLPSQTCNGQINGHANGHTNGNTNGNGPSKPEVDAWVCSGKQRELILKIITESKLDKMEVERLAQDRFAKGVKALNKLEASGLIEELLAQTGQAKPRNARFTQKAGAR